MRESSARLREPIFNVPTVIVIVIGLLVVIHGIRQLVPAEVDEAILELFAFVPDRYLSDGSSDLLMSDSWGPYLWSFFSYTLLHADLTHLISNCVAFAALGNLLARRLGTSRFLAFCAVTGAVSALGELAIAAIEPGPVIGISGVICALMGAMARFVFPPRRAMIRRPGFDPSAGRGGEADWTDEGPDASDLPALLRPTGSIVETLLRPKVAQFILAFVIMNLLLVFGAPALMGSDGRVAWMVHAAGFVAGFLLFPALDPLPDMLDQAEAAIP
eukprot:gene19790-20271_t